MNWSITKNDEERAEEFAFECYSKALDNEYRKQFYGLGELIQTA